MGEVIKGPWSDNGTVVPIKRARKLSEQDLHAQGSRRHPTHPAGRKLSPAWAVTPESSGLHCTECGLVFATGHLPPAGKPLVCRECRDNTTTTPQGDTLPDPLF